MAHTYTPGLTVSERTLLVKRRQLPIPGSVLVRAGDAVTPQTIVARAELPGKVHAVNVANLLGIAPDEIPEYMGKREGERVEKDEVLAENKPFIKWLKTEVRAPATGTIESASTITGQVLLREPPQPLDLPAYVSGRVTEVIPNQGVTIETRCALVQGIFGIGGETWGEVALAVESPDDPCPPSVLQPEMRGKIVVCGAFLGADTLQRAKELGIAGLVVGGIHDKDLRALLGYDLGVAITGSERVGLTLMLTEGFGAIPIAKKTFALLSRSVGRQASLSGATQIRAGVIRPEIVIAQEPGGGVGEEVGSEDGGTERSGIQVGDQARIIRDPFFGRIGQVVGLPPELRQIETESWARVLEIALDDGSVMTVPRANVEIIEEGRGVRG